MESWHNGLPVNTVTLKADVCAISAWHTGSPHTAIEVQAPATPTTPYPDTGFDNLTLKEKLSWEDGADGESSHAATSFDVYFGTSNPPGAPEAQGNQTGTTFDPGTLDLDTTYYWRVDAINPAGKTTGDVWSFSTYAAAPTAAPYEPAIL